MRKWLSIWAAAASVAGVVAVMPPAQRAAAAQGATVFVIPCDGLQTWTFSTPLTLGFTASGTITETWDTPDQCNEFYAIDSPLGQIPNVDWIVESASNPGLDTYSGSCVIAAATLLDTGASALLLGGVVAVSQDNRAPGDNHAEVDVVATTAPCDETTATGADTELRTITVVGK